MKLSFTTKDGKKVAAEAADEDLVVTEIKQGADDFIMLRFKPGTLTVSVPDDAVKYLRFD